jgi:hypothetical protein
MHTFTKRWSSINSIKVVYLCIFFFNCFPRSKGGSFQPIIHSSRWKMLIEIRSRSLKYNELEMEFYSSSLSLNNKSFRLSLIPSCKWIRQPLSWKKPTYSLSLIKRTWNEGIRLKLLFVKEVDLKSPPVHNFVQEDLVSSIQQRKR